MRNILKSCFSVIIIAVLAFSGCEAGLSQSDSSNGDSGDEFSFSEIYSNIKAMKLEISSLKKVNEEQALLIRMSTPAGTMAPFAGLKEGVPEGWLLCDGSEVSPGSYPELYAAIGTNWGGDGSSVFNLPDLRGRFLRGADFDRAGETRDAVDPDRASRIALYSGGSTGALAGSYQGDAYQYHTHYLESWAGYNSNGYANSRNSGYGSGGPHGENIPTRRSDGDYSTETRPENAYVNYIIKY